MIYLVLSVKKPPQPAVQKPSPPKKIKIVKTETGRVIDEEAWYAEVEELKRKVIPPPKLAAAAPVTVPKKSSVFERLGEGSVTSTTPDTPSTSLKVLWTPCFTYQNKLFFILTWINMIVNTLFWAVKKPQGCWRYAQCFPRMSFKITLIYM